MKLLTERSGLIERPEHADHPVRSQLAERHERKDVPIPDAQMLIEEARRRQRHRRGFIVLTALALAGAVLGYALADGGPNSGGSASTNVGVRHSQAPGLLPTGRVVNLDVGGDLAVGSGGALYVAAPAQHQILVRLADGRFAVVAGDGERGYSGNGVPALRARLSAPYDLTFGPGGSLWFADEGRVREISPSGIIRTVAGNGVGARSISGRSPAHPIANGAAALSVSLGPQPYIAVGPTGTLYIDTTSQLWRLAGGRLETIVAKQGSFGAPLPRTLEEGLGPLAVDGSGNLDVSGFNGWGVWRVLPDGAAHYLGYARRSGGSDAELVRGPGGAVYADSGSTIFRLGPTSPRAAEGDQPQPPGPVAYNLNDIRLRGEYFWLTSFAFGHHGVLYADEIPGGGGFERHQQLISLSAGHAKLLWQQAS